MYKYEGVKGFFKGNGTNIVRIAPFSAFEFFFYEFYKHHLFYGSSATDFGSKLICGGLTGMTASTLVSSIIILSIYIFRHIHLI
jgi:solute carrier family 25 phosphate transporter 23/24/25/41